MNSILEPNYASTLVVNEAARISAGVRAQKCTA